MQDRWRQVEQLYHAALERPLAERDAFLKSQCDDEALRAEVHSLLAQDSKSGLFADPTQPEAGESGAQLSVGATIGPYTLEALIGKGGMGEVFRATDTRLGRTVAIKGCDARFSERFNREARAISSLNHPNICTLHDVGPNFIVMELVEGETLAGLLKRGPLPPHTAARYGMQIADALAEAHVRRVVHRDLKPANVMVTRHGVKVLDFGLAKIALESELDLTRTNTVMGTPAYMAPEQVEGKVADSRADLFSLGLILYEMAAGQLPFPGASLASMLVSGNVSVPPPSKVRQGVPAALDALVAKLLAKDPASRPRTAVDVMFGLRRLAEEPEPRGPSRLSKAVVVLLVLVWAGAGFIAYRQLFQDQGIGAAISAVPITGFPDAEFEPSFSPDGKQIVFTGRDGSASSIFTMAIGSQTRRRITEGPANERWSTWSPDGNQIAFLKEAGGPNWEVSTIPAGGGPSRTLGTVRLSQGQMGRRPLAWTPDSQSLVVATQNEAKRGVLALLSVENGTFRPLNVPILHGQGLSDPNRPDLGGPAVSPDGRWLGYVDGGQAMVHHLGAAYAPEGRPIDAPIKTTLGVDTAWLGDRLIFSYSEVITDFKLVEWDLGSKVRTFWVGAPLFGGIAVSAAGDRVRIVTAQGSVLPQLVVQPLDPMRRVATGLPVHWPRSPVTDSFPAYSPDGARVVFATNRTGRVELWVAQPRGDGERQLSNSVQGTFPQWSRNGLRLAFSRVPDLELMLLDLASGIATSFPTHPQGTYAHWSLDGKYIYAGNGRGQIIRVRIADGAMETIAPGTRAQETPDGEALIISRPNDGLYSRPVAGDLAHNMETLLVKDSPSTIAVKAKGVYYNSPLVRYFDFATRKVHDVGPTVGANDTFDVSPDERELIHAPGGRELDLISLEFRVSQ